MHLTPRRRVRRLTIQRGRDEGASVVIVTILLATGVVIGMCALTVDVGLAYAERRQVQNGAEAAALAVAGNCARVPTTCASLSSSLAGSFADLNAADSATSVSAVCGVGGGLPTCPGVSGSVLSRCSATTPTGVSGWVEVRTATETAGGSGLLPPIFSSAATGDEDGIGLRACARATWGPPASIVATPITISRCEWDSMTATGSNFAPPPPYGGTYPRTYEREIYLHKPTGGSTCPTSGGAGADLPGGFGWLEGPGCTSTVTATGTVDAGEGSSEWNDCKSRFNSIAAAGGGLVYVPVYTAVNWTGSGAGKKAKSYTLDGFAAFYLTGWSLPSKDQASVATGRKYCSSSEWCLYGWFTQALVPVSDIVPTTGSPGTPRGVLGPPRLVG